MKVADLSFDLVRLYSLGPGVSDTLLCYLSNLIDAVRHLDRALDEVLIQPLANEMRSRIDKGINIVGVPI
ncbi:MAG: hypothetical protein ACAH95_11765 [Fimbriimonas sp.]